MQDMNIYTPAAVDKIKSLLKKNTSRILAGGTDILLKRDELINEDIDLIDLSRVEELKFIKKEQGVIKLGAMTTFSQIANDKLINKYIPALAQAACQLGSVQIRNRATIGGNVAHASPAADSVPVLMAHSTRVKIMKSDGSTKILDLIEAIREIDNNTLLISLILPQWDPAKNFSYYNKIGTRKSVTIARINLAAVINYDPEEERIKEDRIVLGALGKEPFRARDAEKVITGCILNSEIEKEFLDILTETVDRAIPGRYSQPYKRNAIRGLGDDFITAFKGGLNDE